LLVLFRKTFEGFGKGLKLPIHHLEDLETGSEGDPELRQQAREMIDQARGLRKRIDDLRIEALAQRKLEEGGI